MPPRRRETIVVMPECPVASRHLSQSYYQLLKDLGQQEECPICMESVTVTFSAFCLLKCGHIICARCYIEMEERNCPVCRQ